MLIITTVAAMEQATADAIRDYLQGEETIAEYATVRHITGAATVMISGLPDYADEAYLSELASVFFTFPTITWIRIRTDKAIAA